MDGDNLLAGGLSTLGTFNLQTGWTFVSDEIEKEGNTTDADYMYFGYWLKSPVEHSNMVADMVADYKFYAFYGGNAPRLVSDDITGDINLTTP